MTPPRQWLAVLLLLAALGLVTMFLPNTDLRPPKLLDLIVVDQLRPDYTDRFREDYEGEFRWPLAHGAYFPDANYRHAMTVTAAVHGTIATGLHPSTRGIVGNSWRQRAKGEVYAPSDVAPTLGAALAPEMPLEPDARLLRKALRREFD